MKGPLRNIWMLSREYGNIAGAGGVKDVVQQLAESLARWNGRKVSVVLPFYGFIDSVSLGATPHGEPLVEGSELCLTLDMNYDGLYRQEMVRVWSVVKKGVTIYLLDATRFRDKSDVYTYTASDEMHISWQKQGRGHYDYFAMNVLLQKSALALMVRLGEHPDIIHCHDAHTALLPALLNYGYGWRDYFRSTGVVVTIHNAGVGYHQEVEDLTFAEAICALPKSTIAASLLAGAFDPFLAASSCAILNTVSENYARELQYTSEDSRTGWLGHELKSRGIHLEGITNGIDPARFHTQKCLEAIVPLDDRTTKDVPVDGKIACKRELLDLLAKKDEVVGFSCHGHLSLPAEAPLFTFIARLNEQKGIDLLIQALPPFLKACPGAQVVLQGSGPDFEEQKFKELVARPEVSGRLMFVSGYFPELAKSIFAAGDFFIVPSLYEPCGLTDFIAQLHGSIPIVHHVGGLVKVVDGETGIAFKEPQSASLQAALHRAMNLYNNKEELNRMQKAAIRLIENKYTWDKVKSHYLNLYKKAVNLKRAQLQEEKLC